MAYGQGMMLDSIRNVLNRRQAARAEDDQFQLAQDRGESALERLRAQADMSTARAQAQGENDMLKEHLRAFVNMRGQDKKLEGAGVVSGGRVNVQGLKNQGNEKTTEMRLREDAEKRKLSDVLAGRKEKNAWEMNRDDNETLIEINKGHDVQTSGRTAAYRDVYSGRGNPLVAVRLRGLMSLEQKVLDARARAREVASNPKPLQSQRDAAAAAVREIDEQFGAGSFNDPNLLENIRKEIKAIQQQGGVSESSHVREGGSAESDADDILRGQ